MGVDSSFYRSKEWTKFRQLVIDERVKEDGLVYCEHCGKPIVKAYDIIAHHIEALTESNVNDVGISLNSANIQLVHHICHNHIHDKLGYRERKVYLVYGSPLSGKRTYVDSVRCDGDLIIDVDSIWQCVSGVERYEKDGRLNACIFTVRDALIDCVKYRRGRWNNAYIIGGYPLIGERERLCKMVGAEEIYIECTKEDCLTRLEACKDNRNKLKADWKKYISDWWERYTPT